MNQQEKIAFVKNFTASVTETILAMYEAGKIPEKWNGFEIRQHIADTYAKEAIRMDQARMKAYRNDVIINNL